MYSRLVKADSVRQDLKGWLGRGSVHVAGRTELSTDLVRASCGGVAGKSSFGEVPALLGLILSKSGGIEIGLGDGDVKDSCASRDCDGDCHIHAGFGSC